MTQTLSVTEARSRLLELVDRVDRDYLRIDLTKKGRIKATLVSSDYLDILEETIYSLENSIKTIKQSEKDIKTGKFTTLTTLKNKKNLI
ncbi:hypothetical protein A3A66_02920 [Microgenomates group bacterium RIFCSPLOWO2_01_FULL_46_13]|nr:MAG: hypothetical protein A2783_05305 [Microgenomates group bacterium RIFCSPHIGHO2_01_FULL_45_11]OGV95125.1 MAG: hypothetical protein A3A66_02920 [Microgenomates group bacterium RIFCSPLOWO2_01_FULL_46_13]